MNFTIGLVGGGQLGRMMAYEAFKKGYKVAVLDPDPEAPAMQVAHFPVVGNYDDEKSFNKLVEISNVITYEFENIEPQLLIDFSKKIPVYPNPEILKISQNRIKEKEFIKNYGISIPEIFPIFVIEKNIEQIDLLYQKLKDTKKSWIIKSATGGYDGKYQIHFNSIQYTKEKFQNEIFEILNSFNKENLSVIIEEKIDYDFEFSLIGCGYKEGNNFKIEFFEPFINEHYKGILRKTFGFKESILLKTNIEEIKNRFYQIIMDYKYIGLLTIEFFYKNNKIYFNELAPRPHNSGHLTIEGYTYSQFEQHIRAITGLKIHKPYLKENAGMLNLISYNNLDKDANLFKKIVAIPDVYFHYYGKKQPKHKRKMGHITVMDSSKEKLLEKIHLLENWIYS